MGGILLQGIHFKYVKILFVSYTSIKPGTGGGWGRRAFLEVSPEAVAGAEGTSPSFRMAPHLCQQSPLFYLEQELVAFHNDSGALHRIGGSVAEQTGLG